MESMTWSWSLGQQLNVPPLYYHSSLMVMRVCVSETLWKSHLRFCLFVNAAFLGNYFGLLGLTVLKELQIYKSVFTKIKTNQNIENRVKQQKTDLLISSSVRLFPSSGIVTELNWVVTRLIPSKEDTTLWVWIRLSFESDSCTEGGNAFTASSSKNKNKCNSSVKIFHEPDTHLDTFWQMPIYIALFFLD